MKYIEALILERIHNAHESPWFPGLAEILVAQEWNRLKQTSGIDATSYSSQAILSGKVEQVEKLTWVNGNRIPIVPVPAECLGESDQYGSYIQGDVLPLDVKDCIEEAFAILETEKTIAETVLSLVKNLHILKLENDAYDTSFSLPNIPFSIFISVPTERLNHDSLRVAEAILHESMHLQLSLIEKNIRLMAEVNQMFYSPWKAENRDAGGILHALYVFQTIRGFVSQLLNNEQYENFYSYLNKRKNNIEEEISSISGFEKSNALTDIGKLLAQKLIN